jgi:hypothetical protein
MFVPCTNPKEIETSFKNPCLPDKAQEVILVAYSWPIMQRELTDATLSLT